MLPADVDLALEFARRVVELEQRLDDVVAQRDEREGGRGAALHLARILAIELARHIRDEATRHLGNLEVEQIRAQSEAALSGCEGLIAWRDSLGPSRLRSVEITDPQPWERLLPEAFK